MLRVHTFGIGSDVSTDLIKNAAIAGNGMYYFIDDPNEIEKNVIDSLSITLFPYLVVESIKLLD